jgi:predicted dinucleotide-binding enzyme
MRIGIIGAGHIGSTLARHFAAAGHQVALANSRGPETLAGLTADIGGGVRAVTAAEAAGFGEVAVVSIPFGRIGELPRDGLSGRIVVDTCNYYPQRDGHRADLDDGSATSSEKVRAATGGDVVKAFNAIFWENLRDRGRPEGDPERLAIPLSGDGEKAKKVVAGLIREIGFDPVDAGALADGGRRHQPGTDVYTAELPAADMAAVLRAA